MRPEALGDLRARSSKVLPIADVNLVRLPDEMEFANAAALGCRFVTAFRGVATQARLRAGEDRFAA